jgi:hypothetical protein
MDSLMGNTYSLKIESEGNTMACWMAKVSSSGTLTKTAVMSGRGTLDGLNNLDGLGIIIIFK